MTKDVPRAMIRIILAVALLSVPAMAVLAIWRPHVWAQASLTAVVGLIVAVVCLGLLAPTPPRAPREHLTDVSRGAR